MFESIISGENRTAIALEVCLHLWEIIAEISEQFLQNCREQYGEHTCDKRSSRTVIHSTYPQFEIEEGFTEDDELWTLSRESTVHVAIRAKAILDRIFSVDEEHCMFFFPLFLLIGLLFVEQVISITAHGGIINAILRVVGRQDYALPTGGMHVLFALSEMALTAFQVSSRLLSRRSFVRRNMTCGILRLCIQPIRCCNLETCCSIPIAYLCERCHC